MPTRPTTPEQKADAKRLKVIFERWKDARRDERTYEEIAESIGMTQSAFSQRLNGTMALNADSAAKFAVLLGCKVDDFSPSLAAKIAGQAAAAKVGAPVGAFEPGEMPGDEEVDIPEYTVKFRGGKAGHIVTSFDEVTDIKPARYQISYFQTRHLNPKKCLRFRVVGRSMEPLLFPGDAILVNTEEKTVREGFVYAFRHGDELKVKKLIPKSDGGLVLQSVNREEFPDDVLSPQLVAEQIEIIGRVRDRSGGGGL